MSVYNKVVWSEGLFLQPQHFQQQDRYVERYIESRCQSLIGHSWGFTEIEIERDFLSIGKFGLTRLAGVFPDGTPFRMPDDDPLPVPIDVGATVRDQLLYLAVPLRRAGELEVDRAAETDGLVRHDIRELQARDAATGGGNTALVEVAALRTRLLLASDLTQAYATLPLAHLVECRADKQVVLEDRFIPTVLHVRAASRLVTLTTEILGLLHQRGEALSGRVMATGRGAAAEFADFLMLQVINRFEPLFAHYADSGAEHPEALYQLCASAAGELATFTTTSKRPPKFPGYRHERLRESFEPVVASLRASLSVVLEQSAISSRSNRRSSGSASRSSPTGRSTARRSSSWPPAPTCRRRSCAGGFPRSSRSVRSRRFAISSPCSCPACRSRRFQWRRGRFRFMPASRISSSIKPASCGNK